MSLFLKGITEENEEQHRASKSPGLHQMKYILLNICFRTANCHFKYNLDRFSIIFKLASLPYKNYYYFIWFRKEPILNKT